jgi:hypothetical protein
MKFFLGILVGLFVLSRLQNGQATLTLQSNALPTSNSGMGEIPYGGGAGIITPSPEPFLGNQGVGGGYNNPGVNSSSDPVYQGTPGVGGVQTVPSSTFTGATPILRSRGGRTPIQRTS